MKRLKNSDLQVDMIVAEDIFGRSGEIVMPTGTQLTEKNIKLLENWGISSVAVEGEEEDIAGKFSAEQVADVEKEIHARFDANAKENPFIVQLMKLCVQRRLKQKLAPNPTVSSDSQNTSTSSPPQPEAPQTT